MRLLLDQDDASTLTRNLQYHEYLIAARREKMQVFLDAIQRLTTIEQETAANISELQTLQATLEQETTQLQTERDARKKLADDAAADLKAKGAELEKLEQDRDTLQKVIARIEQQRAIAQAQEEKRRQEALQMAQQQKEQQEQQQQAQQEIQPQETQKTAGSDSKNTDKSAPAYSTADLVRLQSQSFTQRKGRMPWPTNGKLVNRFGDRRQGSVSWDGLRIQAANGTDVRAIHGGRVMYADSLRGQGLLVVLDHGDGYMSLYAHNDVLLREAGEWVQPGDVIARVGNSGGEKEPALYFEIRQNGNPVNPLPWLGKQP